MQDHLIERIRECPNLPSLPAIAVQVLELAQQPEVDLSDVARIISKDPALSGKILRTVNSSFYGRSQEVSTISHALVILGLQSVKTLVLGFSLVQNLSKSKSNGFKHVHYWRRSVYAATAARVLANKLGVLQQEEAFLASLLMDIGMLVFDQVIGPPYGELFSRAGSHGELFEMERAEFEMTHADVSGFLAQQWKLPPVLAVPIAHHHELDNVRDPAIRKLAQIVHVAALAADVFIDDNAAPAITLVRQTAQKLWELDEKQLDGLLQDIGSRTSEVASLFEINIGSHVEYTAILKKANDTLIELTLHTQQQAQQLQVQNQQLKRRATTDLLTGLANRGEFDTFLATHFGNAVSNGQPISLLMIDIDRFKSINDTHGHQTGDAVLQHLGKLLQTAVRSEDLAARYGGEEMALVLPGTVRVTAAAIAETIRRSLASKPISVAGKQLAVTMSVGVASWEPGSPLSTAAHLIKAADLAVYNAKHSGRNCVKVFTLKTPQAA
jgi:diguanylate cyclase (GGDEF)-like protein